MADHTRGLPRPGGLSAAAFVGRERELAGAVAALSESPALLLVEGEAGIGKTRLVRETLGSAPLRDRRVLQVVCPPLSEPFPLGAVVDALHRLVARDLALSPLAGALRPLFPEWADELPPALEPLEDPKGTRHRLLRAMTELVERSGVDVLVVEDAHWADAATLELLLMLAAVDPGVSLVVTYRPTDVPAGSLLLRLTSRSFASLPQARVVLDPLQVDETRQLVASMFDAEQVSETFVSFLHERTEGVPLALEESVSLLHDRGDIVWQGGEWSRRAVEDLQVPPTVRDSVLERVERLPATAQRVLEAAAVLGEPTAEPLLARVAGGGADVARRGLARALAVGLLQESAPGRFAFRHALAARAVEEAVPASERRRLHGRAAAALLDVDPPPVARLSRHFREAGDLAAWSQHAEAAADLAMESGDDRAAVVLLLDLLTGTDPAPDRRAGLARKLGATAAWGAAALGDLGTSVTVALHAVIERDDTSIDDRGELRLLLGRLLLQFGEFDAAAEQSEAAVGDLGGQPALAARAMISLGLPHGHSWPVTRHLAWLDRATRLFDQVDSRAERTWLAVDRASALLMLGEESGWQAAAEIPDDTPTDFEQRQVARCLMNVGHLAIGWGRDDHARRQLVAAIELMQSTGYHRLLNSARLTQAYLDWHSGAWKGLADRVTEVADADGTLPAAQLEAQQILALLDLVRGDRPAAERGLRAILEEVTRRGLFDASMTPAAMLGRLSLADDAAADALALTTPGIESISRTDLWVWATDIAPVHLDALVSTGQIESAEALVRRFADGLGDRDAPAPAAALHTCRGIVAESHGALDEAGTEYAAAAQAWSALPRPYDELLAVERQGRCLLVAGDSAAALRLLATAQDRLQELGARWDADRVAHLLRRHGVEVARVWRGGRRGYGDQLSPREQEVARLVAQGLTNRQVAEALFLSPRTVDRHLSAAMRKLGVSSRTALAVAATTGTGAEPGN